MKLLKWECLPQDMQTEAVRHYYAILEKKKCALLFKRAFDVFASFLLLLVLSPVFLILAILVKVDSRGPVFYRQERITQYGRKFRIFKFRTMVANADQLGTQVTVHNDSRITRVGRFLRKTRLDEISQLIDVLRGTLTFVGTRPEVEKYVRHYTDEMKATLLLPAGITSEASIRYKDESALLDAAGDAADKIYVQSILPSKMKYNLHALKTFRFWKDIKIMFMTVFAIFGKEYSDTLNADAVREKTEVLK
ncbi:MAG: sugar transferase [Clostridia bacterium]|nr:sugar transferase [Clostridia bacterium]MBQ3482877.1 sugar transferase [Clostridia bacterium]